jgi:hypothetical protein
MLNRLRTYSKSFLRQQLSQERAEPNFTINEILPVACRRSQHEWNRINLLIPALSARYVFGGIRTALDFFEALMEEPVAARIIITDEVSSDLAGIAGWKDWLQVDAEQDNTASKQIVCFGNRYQRSIPVAKGDVFVATAWWTAYAGERIQQWQESEWKTKAAPLVYCIQDFEPGFYKWSSRYLLAESTYHNKNSIAVINSPSLANYFEKQGFRFSKKYVFTPVLHPVLKMQAAKLPEGKRNKQILFYGRPSVERNAIELIIAALRIWSANYANASNWTIVSAGEDYTAPALLNGAKISVLGKLSIDAYAKLLSDSAIGIALMVSPHPSYPPVEMAAFGMQVISNRFPEKDLSADFANIASLETVTPETIAAHLTALCRRFEQGEIRQHMPVFSGNKQPFPFIKQLLQDAGLLLKQP